MAKDAGRAVRLVQSASQDATLSMALMGGRLPLLATSDSLAIVREWEFFNLNGGELNIEALPSRAHGVNAYLLSSLYLPNEGRKPDFKE